MRCHRRVALAATLLGAIACGPSGTEPEPDPDIPVTLENIATSYEATHFVGGGFDVLALGGSLDLTLDQCPLGAALVAPQSRRGRVARVRPHR